MFQKKNLQLNFYTSEQKMMSSSFRTSFFLTVCLFLFSYPLFSQSQVFTPNAPMCCFKHGVTAKVSNDCKADLMDMMEKSAADWPSHREERANWIAWDCSTGYAQCCLVNERIDTWIVEDASACDNNLNPEITLQCGVVDAVDNVEENVNEEVQQPEQPQTRQGWGWWFGNMRKLRA